MADMTKKSARNWHKVDILHKCLTDDPLQILMKITSYSDGTQFRNQVLNPLIKNGLIEMTIPDKPQWDEKEN